MAEKKSNSPAASKPSKAPKAKSGAQKPLEAKTGAGAAISERSKDAKPAAVAKKPVDKAAAKAASATKAATSSASKTATSVKNAAGKAKKAVSSVKSAAKPKAAAKTSSAEKPSIAKRVIRKVKEAAGNVASLAGSVVGTKT